MGKNDLTKGNIWKQLSLYFLPLALGTIFQQLYNAVDGIIVGKFVGTIALAAVGGSAALISNALVNFFVALTGGGSVLIAQFFGANNEIAMKRATHTSMLFSGICGIFISISGYILTPQMLTLMKTPEESMEDSVIYLRIIFIGAFFQLVYNMAAGILRAVGNSRSPFIYLAVCCSLNILLDLLAIRVLHMGVAGAAYATIVSQAICCAAAVSRLFRDKDEIYGLKLGNFAIHGGTLGRMLKIGVPLALQSLMYSITNILIQVGINSLGTIVVASWALTSRLDGFFWGFMSAANVTISNFIGQNFGKGDFDRMKKGVKCSFVLFMSLGIAFCIVLLTCSKFVLPWFTDDPEVIDCSLVILSYFAPLYWIWTINEVFSGALRGEGKTLVPFLIVAGGICAFRLIWLETAFVARPTLFILSIAYPISWVIAGSGMFIYYLYHVKHRNMVK